MNRGTEASMKKQWLAVVVALLVLGTAGVAQQTSADKRKPAAGRVSLDRSRVVDATAAEAQQPEPAAAPALPAKETPVPSLNERSEAMPANTANVLPIGTTLRMKLETPLSTSMNKAGDIFSGKVTEAVMVDGHVLIPSGSTVEGRVIHVSESRRIRGVPVIQILPETVMLPGGERYNLNAVVVDTTIPKQINVDEEGRMKSRSHTGKDLRDLAIGGGGGAIVGTVLVHTVRGALIGAGVGMGVEAVLFLMRKHSQDIPAGTDLFLELSRPLTVTAGNATLAASNSGGK